MKYIFIIFILLLTTVISSQGFKSSSTSINNILEAYKWKNRILLLIADKEDVTLINAVDKFFIDLECENEDRNLGLLKIIKNKYTNLRMPEYLRNKKGIWLIGYDGFIKAYSKDKSLLLNIHSLIDKMPVRKEEMNEFKRNCQN